MLNTGKVKLGETHLFLIDQGPRPPGALLGDPQKRFGKAERS